MFSLTNRLPNGQGKQGVKEGKLERGDRERERNKERYRNRKREKGTERE